MAYLTFAMLMHILLMAKCNYYIVPLQPPPLEIRQDASQIDGPSPKNAFGFEFSPTGSGQENRMQTSQVRKHEYKVFSC